MKEPGPPPGDRGAHGEMHGVARGAPTTTHRAASARDASTGIAANTTADVQRVQRLTEWAVVAIVTAVVVWRVRPSLVLTDTLPAGGDLSAHSWGPDFLRRVLLPSVSGWSWDWLAGFPAFSFYPVLPALLVDALDVVLPFGVAMKLCAVVGPVTLPAATWGFARWWRLPFPTPPLLAVAGLAFVFDSHAPYGGTLRSAVAGEYSYSIGM